MKKLIFLILLLSCCCSALSTQAAPEYVSITALREEVQGGWHQEYQAHGRTITIDLDEISVPAVSSVPILRLGTVPPIDDALLSGYRDVENYRYGNMLSFSMGDPGGERMYKEVRGNYASNGEQFFHSNFDWSLRAEDNPMTAGDAFTILLREVERLYGQEIRDSLVPAELGLVGKQYYYKGFDGNRPQLLEPVEHPDNMGRYMLSLRQSFHGIPVIRGGGGYYFEYVNGAEQTNHPISCDASAFVRTPNDYSLGISILQVLETRYEDVPLAPFAEVKRALETQIENGRLRSIDSLQLGYVQYYDPAGPETCWVVPAWVAFGELYKDAKEEPMHYQDDEMEFTQKSTGWLFVRGQTGLLQDPMDRSLTRSYVPDTFGWDSVR